MRHACALILRTVVIDIMCFRFYIDLTFRISSHQTFSKVMKSERLTDYERTVTTKLKRGPEMRYGNLLVNGEYVRKITLNMLKFKYCCLFYFY